VSKEFERPLSAAAAPLDEVKQTVHSDLQYVSLQADGRTYGGWYRVLPDGKMELLALANMHCERRAENTPIEQARGMLAEFILAARSQPDTKRSTEPQDGSNGTLGGLLYADTTRARIPEVDWTRLVHRTAMGDQLALHDLFERTHRLVFTLVMRLTNDRETSEELTLDVFQNVWRHTSEYDPAKESVVGWIMNQARLRTMDELREASFRGHTRTSTIAVGLDTNDSDGQANLPAHALADDVLHPPQPLWERLAQRLAKQAMQKPISSVAWMEPTWEDVAPGIQCKLLATDTERNRVSMLVRLAADAEYPPHTHAGLEELHLLHGELWIDDRKLHPGDYNRAAPGSADDRVWSETGCTCVLITSTQDVLR
jgi:DNA-directed RNA polymerase specialized sigma24 family protein